MSIETIIYLATILGNLQIALVVISLLALMVCAMSLAMYFTDDMGNKRFLTTVFISLIIGLTALVIPSKQQVFLFFGAELMRSDSSKDKELFEQVKKELKEH